MKTKKQPKKGRTRGRAGDIMVGKAYSVEGWRALSPTERVMRYMKYRRLIEPGEELQEFQNLPLPEQVRILRGDILTRF